MKRIILTVTLILASLVSIGFAYQTPPPKQWEYKWIQTKLDFKKTDVTLNDLGAQGWEAYEINESQFGILNVYLKRPKP